MFDPVTRAKQEMEEAKIALLEAEEYLYGRNYSGVDEKLKTVRDCTLAIDEALAEVNA